jgi:hypothetical protein
MRAWIVGGRGARGGRFSMWACFDDEEQSDTYAEHVERCPGCGAWLSAEVVLAMRKRMRLR